MYAGKGIVNIDYRFQHEPSPLRPPVRQVKKRVVISNELH